MIDLNSLEKYRENNRIEAKKAMGGLPHSIWETYSAFANTMGGIILLGVEEYKDKSLHTVDLPDPDKLVKEFWKLVKNPNKASVNVLSAKDVVIENINGDHIIVIHIPRADRSSKPVYVDGNPLNTYRRNGEGDYKCTDEELHAMYRDASIKTQDMLVLQQMGMDVFNADSLQDYRQRMRISHPGHIWDALEDEEFLLKIGAAGIGEDGNNHPTAAGLLMFGNEYDIVREYPQYFLDFREVNDDIRHWTDRFVSSSGDWSGNVFDFFFRAYNRLQTDLKAALGMKEGFDADNMPVYQAVREGLANCLINADYYGRGGIVIIKRPDEITMSNPGNFRVELAAAKAGGLSDPRNGTMMKMFHMIEIGERTGSGIPNIFRVWHEQGWAEPTITQRMNPDRITLSLALSPIRTDKSAIKSNDKNNSAIKPVKRQMIIDYLTDHPIAKSAEIAGYVHLKPSRVRDYLAELIAEDIVVAEGGNRNRTYRLKA